MTDYYSYGMELKLKDALDELIGHKEAEAYLEVQTQKLQQAINHAESNAIDVMVDLYHELMEIEKRIGLCEINCHVNDILIYVISDAFSKQLSLDLNDTISNLYYKIGGTSRSVIYNHHSMIAGDFSTKVFNYICNNRLLETVMRSGFDFNRLQQAGKDCKSKILNDIANCISLPKKRASEFFLLTQSDIIMSRSQRPVALIMGASGFIGRNLVNQFKTEYQLVLLFHNKPGEAFLNLLPEGTCYYVGDMNHKELMLRIFLENKIDLVLDFAGASTTGVCIDIHKAYEQNLLSVINLITLTAKQNKRPKGIIVPSTRLIDSLQDGVFEQDPFKNYAFSKKLMEDCCIPLARQLNIPLSVMRLPNIFGENDQSTSRLIPKTVEKVRKGEKLTYRADQNGISRKIELLHVDDLGSRVLSVASRMMRGNWNFSDNPYCFQGTTISIKDIMVIISYIFGDQEIEIMPDYDGGPPEEEYTINNNAIRQLVKKMYQVVNS